MKILMILSITINSALAAFPIIDVKNISGDYLDGNGTAYALKASYKLPKVRISHENIDVKFNKQEKNLVISDPSTRVELDFDFSFLNVFKAFSFKDLDIQSTDKLFTISSDEFDLYIDPKKYHLEELYVETDVRNIPTQDDEDISVVDGLILNASLLIRKMTFAAFEDIIFDDMRTENPAQTVEINEIQRRGQSLEIPMIVRKVDYRVKDGIFDGKALIDSYINLWLRVGGKMTSNKDNTKIDIFLLKAKLGIFSIKKTLLKQIKRLELDGVTVKGSTIHVDLKTVATNGQEQK